MKRRPIDERLERLEADYALTEQAEFDLSVLTDDELQAVADEVETGVATPLSWSATDKARAAARAKRN